MSLLLRVARSPAGRLLVGQVFSRMSFLLPVDRLIETETLVAFHHPRPGYSFHVLLVPKRALSSLADLTAADADFSVELFQAVNELVREFDLERDGYRLISNGGSYQEVPHLHFHLVSNRRQQEE